MRDRGTREATVKRIGLVGLFVAVGVLVYLASRAANTDASETDASEGAGARREEPSSSQVLPSPLAAPEPVDSAVRATRPGPIRVSAERRKAILAALSAAGASPLGARLDADENEDSAPVAPTRLTTKQYLAEQVDALKPLLEECYAAAKALDPGLSPHVPVAFTIGGEPGVGGLVTEAEVHPDLASHAGLVECIRETLFTLEIDPPEEGGVVAVRYPFDFSHPEGAEEQETQSP
jgi:cobalamin biosynthesis protein CbiG